jgi:hypothetical protein
MPKLIACIMHIAMQYPDRTPIEDEKFNGFLEVLDRQFPGSSPLGVIQGRWLGIVEPMLRIEVAIQKKQIPIFEKLARYFGREMKQKEVYVVINYQSEARCLPLDYGDGGDDQRLKLTGGAQ